MVGFFRGALAMLIVLGITWGGVISYWRHAGTVPNARDILAYLGLLPAGLFGGAWALRRFAARVRDAAAARSASAGADAAVPEAETDGGQPDAAQQPAAVLASSVRLPLDLTAESLLAEPLATARLRAHPAHRDRSGLPIYLAMAEEVQTLAPLPPELEAEQSEHARRALCLLEPVVEELMVEAARALPALASDQGRVIAGWRQTVNEVVPCQLSIELLVPGDWPAFLREACDAWLRRSAAEQGIDARRFAVDVVPVDDADAAWSRLLRRVDGPPRQGPAWLLALACHSDIGAARLDRLESLGSLRTARLPGGNVPGEAAAGVLLGWAGAGSGFLKGIERAALPDGANAASRGRLTSALAETALERSSIEASRIDIVLSDADMRVEAAAEGSGVASRICQDIDLSRQYLALGTRTGNVGAVQPLAQLALAQRHLQSGGAAALIVAVASAEKRWIAVLDSLPPDQRGPDDARATAAAQTEPV